MALKVYLSGEIHIGTDSLVEVRRSIEIRRLQHRGEGFGQADRCIAMNQAAVVEYWQIEAADATPNLNGSPGLFGNSTDAEFFIDNVQVTANK